MKETIFKIFDTFTEGVDTYYHNGSMWLIFTDEQKWVIELAQDGILWYNSYFFGDCLKYVSLDVVENQHYITEWVEDIIQKDIERTELSTAGIPFRKKKSKEVIQNGVKSTCDCILGWDLQVENIIQNGVKSTESGTLILFPSVEDIIQNGVKELKGDGNAWVDDVREVTEKGIKETNHCSVSNDENAKDALQSGVKVTKALGPSEVTEKEINRVIKETHEDVYQSNARVWGVVNNGIKQTNPHFLQIMNPMNFEPEIKEMKRMNEVNIILEKGIKQTIELPDMSGELNGYGEYYARQKDRTYPHTDIVNDVINGK